MGRNKRETMLVPGGEGCSRVVWARSQCSGPGMCDALQDTATRHRTHVGETLEPSSARRAQPHHYYRLLSLVRSTSNSVVQLWSSNSRPTHPGRDPRGTRKSFSRREKGDVLAWGSKPQGGWHTEPLGRGRRSNRCPVSLTLLNFGARAAGCTDFVSEMRICFTNPHPSTPPTLVSTAFPSATHHHSTL